MIRLLIHIAILSNISDIRITRADLLGAPLLEFDSIKNKILNWNQIVTEKKNEFFKTVAPHEQASNCVWDSFDFYGPSVCSLKGWLLFSLRWDIQCLEIDGSSLSLNRNGYSNWSQLEKWFWPVPQKHEVEVTSSS